MALYYCIVASNIVRDDVFDKEMLVLKICHICGLIHLNTIIKLIEFVFKTKLVSR